MPSRNRALALALAVAACFATCSMPAQAEDAPIYKDVNAPTANRVDDLLGRLTREEKIKLMAGVDSMYTQSIDRLGIPRLKMTDGPNGTRVWGKSTAYPAGMLLAATWDPALAQREGEQLGRDARARGCHFLLGPGLNIYRHPQNGRNFEYFGEDPVLTGKIAVGYVRGVESQNVAATIKHFAANNQETNRSGGSSDVDERTLREIYLPAFGRVVAEAKPGSAMCAYNRINGTYCSEDKWLLTDVLRGEWKFEGVMMSDWGAVHDTLAPINAGLDLEMPGPENWNGPAVSKLLTDGKIEPSQIDEKVRRLLTLMIGRGWLDKDQTDASVPKDNPDGARVALDVARAGITLLKNSDALLPLDRTKLKNIVVIGHNAIETPVGGGGSGYTVPFHNVTFADGIQQAAGDVKVKVIPGEFVPSARKFVDTPPVDGGTFAAEYFKNQKLEGEPFVKRSEQKIDFRGKNEPAPGVGAGHYSARWTTTITPPKTAKYFFFTRSDDGSRVFVDGKPVLDQWSSHQERMASGSVSLEAGKAHKVVIEFFDSGGEAIMQFGCGIQPPMLSDDDLTAIRAADAVIACVGFTADLEGEGEDRAYTLPHAQDELLEAIASANPHTAVVLNAGGSCDMTRWADKVPAIVHAYYGGQEGGTALADVLFGDVNPSGHLPFTIERKLEDVPSNGNWGMKGKVPYTEGIFVGYRGFDAKKIEPRFPFGHGLSYTTFKLADGEATWTGDELTISTTITNTGAREGATVVQLYVTPPKGDVPRPVKELKAFEKISLRPGESKPVKLHLPRQDLAYWDPATKAWTVAAGEHQLLLGQSAGDLPVRITTRVPAR